MEITEVRVKLTDDSDDRLQAFCSITFDNCFVVRDLKIIEGSNGPFVAMPSRKLTSHCPKCGSKNHLRANYCNQCGSKQLVDRALRDQEGRVKLYADIAHPINSTCREMIQDRVISEYRGEVELAKEPGYVSRYEDEYEDDFDLIDEPPGERGARDSTKKAIQPPLTEPRAPHSSTQRPAETPSPSSVPEPKSRPNEDFGAGIFEE